MKKKNLKHKREEYIVHKGEFFLPVVDQYDEKKTKTSELDDYH